MTFANRVGLVTGAGSGIGSVTAELLAARGATVVVADVDAAAAAETVRRIRQAGGRAEASAADVTRAEDIDAAVALARRAFGGLDVVIHCAGILRQSPLEETSEKEWSEVLAVNLTGAFLVTKAALAALRAEGRGGAIVHIASRAAIRAKEHHAAYSASKAGILQLTQTAALEGAPHRIRVNCVCPGFIDTPMTRGGYEDGAFDAWSRVCPLGRPGRPEDVARQPWDIRVAATLQAGGRPSPL